ncbi:hypothetical protein GQ457_17G005090 [Hibiscus cannabinus]
MLVENAPNGSIDDLNNQNSWKSMSRYKRKILKLHQHEESDPRAKINFQDKELKTHLRCDGFIYINGEHPMENNKIKRFNKKIYWWRTTHVKAQPLYPDFSSLRGLPWLLLF